MSLSSELQQDKYAQIALSVSYKYRINGKAIHDLAWFLRSQDDGKSEGHLTQLAVKWCRETR